MRGDQHPLRILGLECTGHMHTLLHAGKLPTRPTPELPMFWPVFLQCSSCCLHDYHGKYIVKTEVLTGSLVEPTVSQGISFLVHDVD